MPKKEIVYQVQYSCVIEVKEDGPNWDDDGLIVPPETSNIDIPEGGFSKSVYEHGSFEVVDVRDWEG